MSEATTKTSTSRQSLNRDAMQLMYQARAARALLETTAAWETEEDLTGVHFLLGQIDRQCEALADGILQINHD